MTTPLAGRRRFVLVLGCLTGLAAVTIDMSLPAIPEMVRSLDTSMSLGQQIVGYFIAGIAVGQLPAGLISDRIGRMPVLYFGVGLFTAAGIVCAASNDIDLMLAGRFVQGIGASVGIVVSRAIVRDIASGTHAARLLSIMVMIFTAAPMLAPMAGSLLVAVGDWRTPFIVIALCGGVIFLSVSRALEETRRPFREHHILRQLVLSLREFFTHRQSILGLLLVMLTAAGFIAVITSSSALIVEIYGYSPAVFGFIFALAGLSLLAASTLNRRLLLRLEAMQVMGIGVTLIAVAAVQMLVIAWLGDAAFWWLWGTVCVYMFGTALLLPNATALALDPLPSTAGVAASIIGTVQNVAAASSSLIASMLYDGTVGNIVINMGVCGVAVTLTYLGRRLIMGGRPLYVPEV